jgi:oxidase EvaA
VKNIPFSHSEEWVFEGGMLEHTSKKFFRIVGVEWENEKGTVLYQPLIEQKEIGTLGFIFRTQGGVREILVQSKIEPGNVNVVQLSPTCQATESNLLRVHGGEKPPFGDIFSQGGTVLSETLQSEQGTRFLGKFNRNVSLELDSFDNSTLECTHRFVPIDDFLALLDTDYLINTDARSVLVCCPWEKLVTRTPFSRFATPWAHELSVSASFRYDKGVLQERLDSIIEKRSQGKKVALIPLQKLPGWHMTDDEITADEGGSFFVRQIAVTTKCREVAHWDQPILSSVTKGKAVLLCGRKNGILHFLFRSRKEPGFEHFYELGPSIVKEPGSQDSDEEKYVGAVIAECHQSEEGGRFFQEKNHYQIIDIGEVDEETGDDYWLTLSEVAYLLETGGWLTNEARSVLSLLLKWL